jgi:predicted RNA-binding protein associated with RNAse of E/G family
MITVHKLDHVGVEKTAYSGNVIERGPSHIILEAHWERKPLELGYVTFDTGDRFVEYFYNDRWYNVFVIFDAAGVLKGWYCNVTRPARIEAEHLWADDLALDYFRGPDGNELILDEDEFAKLGLNEREAQAARAAMDELRAMAARREGPFDLGSVPTETT